MVEFDWHSATRDERLAEINRRERNRTAGRAPTDDGDLGAMLREETRAAVHRGVPSTGGDMTATEVLARRRDARFGPPSGRFGAPEWTATLPDGRTFTSGGRLTFWLPWSCLIADNAKYAPALRKTGGRQRPVIILTKAYRDAKKKGERIVSAQLAQQGGVLLAGRVRLTARMVEPNRHTRRDLANYAKLVQDVLSGIAYHDDAQIDSLEWSRQAPDIDRPGLELILTTSAT